MTEPFSVADIGSLCVVVDLDYCRTEVNWLSVLNELAHLDAEHPFHIQLRMKDRSEAEVKLLASRAARIIANRVPVMLNGFRALAVDFEFAGVHLPEKQYHELNQLEDSNLHISVASHSLDSVKHVSHYPISMIHYSPIFVPSWKTASSEIKGLAGLREAVKLTTVPVFALGGIATQRVTECLSAGASGVAVLSGILGSRNIAKSIGSYLQLLARSAVT